MQKDTYRIMRNLGYTKELIENIEKESESKGGVLTRKIITILKDLGTPEAALDQIKKLESKKHKIVKDQVTNKTNKELIEGLLRKCRRSFTAFAKKGVRARITFSKKEWVIEASEYDPALGHLHDVCKPHFDEWAAKGLTVIFYFDGSETWKTITKR